jgi:Domain of Unknown Function with PDB structure (DUF3862)
MTQQNPLQLAKQGNPNAIAALINRSLNSQGITAKVIRKDDCLRILLESNEVPNQNNLSEFIRNGIVKLRISEINTLQVFGRQAGEQVPAWSQTINLKVSPSYSTSQQQLSEPHNSQSQRTQNSISSLSTGNSSSTSSSGTDANHTASTIKTSSKENQLSYESNNRTKKLNDLFRLLNSSSETNPVLQLIGIIIISFFALVMWWILGGSFNLSGRQSSRNPSNISIPTFTASATVTFDEYNSLQNGMNYEQASRIIGDPGQEMSRSEMSGTPLTIMYSWQNSDGSNMNAIFQNDELITKAQIGLK